MSEETATVLANSALITYHSSLTTSSFVLALDACSACDYFPALDYLSRKSIETSTRCCAAGLLRAQGRARGRPASDAARELLHRTERSRHEAQPRVTPERLPPTDLGFLERPAAGVRL